MKRYALIIGCLLLLLFIVSVATPCTWDWLTYNLQIRLHNVANEKAHEGSYGESCGWCKLGLFMGDWWRSSRGTTGSGGSITSSSNTVFSIAGVGPDGVSIRVRFHQDARGKTISFDKVIFVPTFRAARLDVSPDIYITGTFEN